MKTLFGQMGEEMLLGGQRVSSEKLEQSGFAFEYTQLDAALEAALAR